MCVFECECVLQSGRRGCGREKGVQVLNSLSLPLCVRSVDGCWIFQLSAAVCLSIVEAVVASDNQFNTTLTESWFKCQLQLLGISWNERGDWEKSGKTCVTWVKRIKRSSFNLELWHVSSLHPAWTLWNYNLTSEPIRPTLSTVYHFV